MTLIPVEKDSPSDPSQTMRMQRSSGAWGAQSQSQDPISRSQKAQNSLPMKSGKPRRAYRLASIFWWLNGGYSTCQLLSSSWTAWTDEAGGV
jgi:hypothetical protein